MYSLPRSAKSRKCQGKEISRLYSLSIPAGIAILQMNVSRRESTMTGSWADRDGSMTASERT